MTFYRVHYKDPKLGKQVYRADYLMVTSSGVVELCESNSRNLAERIALIGSGAFHVIERFDGEEPKP